MNHVKWKTVVIKYSTQNQMTITIAAMMYLELSLHGVAGAYCDTLAEGACK